MCLSRNHHVLKVVDSVGNRLRRRKCLSCESVFLTFEKTSALLDKQTKAAKKKPEVE